MCVHANNVAMLTVLYTLCRAKYVYVTDWPVKPAGHQSSFHSAVWMLESTSSRSYQLLWPQAEELGLSQQAAVLCAGKYFVPQQTHIDLMFMS